MRAILVILAVAASISLGDRQDALAAALRWLSEGYTGVKIIGDARIDTSPLLFGWLIESGSAWRVSAGYALAAALLLIAAGTELVLGINAEGKSLESIADPLSS